MEFEHIYWGENFLQLFSNGISFVNEFVWGFPLLILLFGTHLFFTIRLNFIQRHILKGIRFSMSRERSKQGDISPFASLMVALSATIGTGNIVGVATAIAIGGPGAVLWCWLTGVFGISTKYAESYLSVRYRRKGARGEMIGGPMIVLQYVLKMRYLAIAFAAFTIFASFGIGNLTQGNSASSFIEKSFNISPVITGAVLAFLVGLATIGGVKSISNVCKTLVPFMAVFYVLGCSFILAYNYDYIFPALCLIFKSAFSDQAVGGGFAGSTVMMAARYGIARGLFSNESGLGSAPIVAAAARTNDPVRQALISATGTFWDTVVVCAMTGMVIVSSIIAYPDIDVTQGNALTYAAFSKIPYIGEWVLSIGLLTFVYSTMLGWCYYGEKAFQYLFGYRSLLSYHLMWIIAAFLGANIKIDIVWNFSDLANALMAVPNIISLLLLSTVIAKATSRYDFEKK